jgi:hypothetical protein
MRARLLLVLFVLAAALDAHLALRLRRAEARAPAHASAPAPVACDGVRAELSRCRAESWSVVARAVEAGRAASPSAERPAPAPPGAATREQQRRALCDVAEEDLRRKWEGERDDITRSLRRDLRDLDKQQKEAAKDTEKFASEIGLDPAAQKDLLDAYEPLRRARIAAAASAVEADPPDYGAVLDEVQGLYADEDAVVARLYGEDAKQRLRAAETRGRTTIAAIAATLANAPWDDAIVW